LAFKPIQNLTAMKKIFLFFVFVSLLVLGKAQVTGTKLIGTDYPTLAAAITALNTTGVGTGGAIINVPAGYAETAPVGGFVLGSSLLNASLTAAKPLIIQKLGTGANPILTAFTGGTSTISDGVFKMQGTDYVTIDGIDVKENAVNTGAAFMEWGYALVNLNAAAPFDGCNNNTIKNCKVTLDKANTNFTSCVASLHVIAAATSTTAMTITAVDDLNSNNKFYTNNLSNAHIGVQIAGFAAATPFALYDQGNDVGGSSAATGNTLTNMGVSALWNTFGIFLTNQNGANASYNNIDNAAGGTVTSTTQLIGIISTGTNSVFTANNNTIKLTQSTGSASAVYGINSSVSGTGSVTANSNNVQIIATGAITSIVGGIYCSGTTTTETINNNVLNNWNINTTGTTYLIYASNSTPTVTVNGNSTSGNTIRGGATGTMYGYYNFGSPGSGTATISNNNFSNIALTGATGFYGLYQATSTTQIELLNNNTVNNISGNSTGLLIGVYLNYGAAGSVVSGNTVSNIAGGGTISGIVTGNSIASISLNAYNNNVNNLITIGSSTVTGILNVVGTATNIYKNKIYSIQSNGATGSAIGITISGGTTVTVYNNIIGDIKAINTTNINGVIGLNISGGTTVNAYYNTVNITGTSAGSGFGSSAIFASTTPAVILRNNIFVNTTTPTGTSIAAAYRRSSTILTTYGATSNNNLFFVGAGSCSSTRVIYYDGTAVAQTLAAYKLIAAPRDAASITEDPNYVSTVGVTTTYLHINPAIPTLIESGAASIPTYTDDFDGDIRTGNTDIGADEFAGTIAPACAGTPIAGTATAASASICTGTGTSICLTGQSAASGITVQWQSATVSGGPYTNVPCATGGTGNCYNTGNLAVGTYYYIAQVTCTNSGITVASNQATVVVNALPTIAVSANTNAICSSGAGAILTATGGVTYTWSPAIGLSATTGASVTANPLVTTTYTVTGANAIGCTSTATVTITVSNSPLITATATSNSICLGTTINLTGTVNGNLPPTSVLSEGFESGLTVPTGWAVLQGGTGNLWTVTNTPSGSVRTGTNCAQYFYSTPSAANTYLITSGVSLTAGVPYTVSSWYRTSASFPEKLKVTVGTAQTIAAQTTTIQDLGTIQTGTYTLQTAVYTPTASGNYYFGWNAYSIADQFYINLDDISITSPTTPPTYAWTSTPAGFTSSLLSPTGINPTQTTTYTLTANNPNGCSSSANTTVTINTPIVSGLVTEPTTCVSPNGAITLTIANPANFSFAWTGSGVNATSQNQTGISAGSYVVTVTHIASGCTTVLPFILNGPGGCSVCPTIPSVTPTANNCTGTNITFTNTGLGNMGITYGITYKFSNTILANPYTGGTLIASIPNASLTAAATAASTTTTFASASTYYVYAILTPTPLDVTCRPFSVVNVTVNTTPTVNGVSNQVVCNGSPVSAITFSGAVTGTTYNWTNSNTALGLAASGTGNISSFIATNTGTTISNSTVTVTPISNGCTGASTSFTITVNPTTTVNAIANQSVCNGLSTTAITLGSAVAGTTYAWTNNTPSIGLAASGTTNIASFTGINTGTTPVIATIVVTPTANSCPGTPLTFTITVNPTTPVTLGTFAALCNNAPSFTLSGGAPAGGIYLVDNNPQTVFNPNNYSAGTHIVTYQLTNSSGCVTTTSQTIVVNALPNTDFTVNSTVNQCLDGNAYSFTNTSIGAVTYLWSFGDGTTVTTKDASKTYTNSGYYTINLKATNANGCVGSKSTSVVVLPMPTKPTVVPEIGNGIHSSVLAPTYFWYLNGVLIDNLNTQYIYPTVAGYYSVQIKSADDCTSTSERLFYMPEKNNTAWLDAQYVFVYPIPATNEEINIHFNLATATTVTYSLFTETGQLLQSGVIPTNSRTFKLDVKRYERSNYVLSLKDQFGLKKNMKVQVVR
jgi:trimeric autotransporter adhesin